MTQLTILGTNIRQDADGRYSLGDCWQISGKQDKNRPTKWYEAEKTQDFLASLGGEAENSLTPISVVKSGPNDGRGFWGNREAIIHYAMWINSDFCVHVIRAFDAVVNGKVVRPEHTLSREEQLASAVLLSQDIIREKDATIAELAPKATSFDALANLEGRHNLRAAAAQCGWPEKKFIEKLLSIGWLYVHTATGRKLAYADRIKSGFMEVKNVEVKRTGYVEGVGQPMITQKGLARLKIVLGAYRPIPSFMLESA